LFQLLTRTGIFDIDDIFNNALGALIGYGAVMAVLSIIKPVKGKVLKTVGFLSPLIVTVAAFTGIFVCYSNKEFGNNSYAYNYKLDLKNTRIELNISLKDNKDLVPIYKAPTYSKDEAVS